LPHTFDLSYSSLSIWVQKLSNHWKRTTNALRRIKQEAVCGQAGSDIFGGPRFVLNPSVSFEALSRSNPCSKSPDCSPNEEDKVCAAQVKARLPGAQGVEDILFLKVEEIVVPEDPLDSVSVR
jgi:hypothetical protein